MRTALSERSPFSFLASSTAGRIASIKVGKCPGASPPWIAAPTAPHDWWPMTTTTGVWSGIDALTGALLWQTAPTFGGVPFGGASSGPVTTANGVVFGCALDPLGHMYALNGATGAILWTFASGGSCLSGAAISEGRLFWGSGYSFFGTPNNKLYSFGLPG